MKFYPFKIRHVVLALGLYLGLGVPLLSVGHYWHHFEEAEHHHETEQAIHANDGSGPVIHREHGHAEDHCEICICISTKKETLDFARLHKPVEFLPDKQKPVTSEITRKKILYRTRLPARAPPAVTS